MSDGDGVEFGDAFALRELHVDELGVEAFEVGEDEELFDGGVVTHVAVEAGIGIPPLAGGEAEEGDIEQVGLGGVGEGGLGGRDLRRDQVGLDGVGVDAVVELGKGAIEVPGKGKPPVFVILESLELLDEVDLEIGADPQSELECDIFVGESSTITA